jgi:DNA-binding transcriptional MocR family regulator
MELALRFNILIVCDDVYDKLSFPDASANDIDGMETVRLVQLDTSGRHVISNGSFSKIFGPGIRMGWIETGPWLAEQISNR